MPFTGKLGTANSKPGNIELGFDPDTVPTATASISGAGALDNTATDAHTATADVSGAGSLDNTFTPPASATASVSGAGSLDSTASGSQTATVSVPGAGSLRTTATAGPATFVSVNITEPAGSFFGQVTRPAIIPAGAPTYPLTLYRGAVIGVQANRNNGYLHLALDIEDYNRNWSLANVGVPNAGVVVVQPDGTEIEIDGRAINFGAGDGDVVNYWVGSYYRPLVAAPDTSGILNTNPDYSFYPIFDRTTALTKLDAVLNEFTQQRGGGATRYWTSPRGAGLDVHYRIVGLFDGLLDQRVAAPWALSTEGKAGTIMANIEWSWDHARLRRRLWVRAEVPGVSHWVTNEDAPFNAGDDYVDAPGATTWAEAETVGRWHLRYNFASFLRARAHVPYGHIAAGVFVPNDGWEEGQSTLISDEKSVGWTGHVLNDREVIVQGFRGKLVGPSNGLTIVNDLVDLSNLIVGWEEFDFERGPIGSPGKATVIVHMWDPDARITIRDLGDIMVKDDGTAAIEYDLDLGDMPGGDLALQVSRDRRGPPPSKPVYKWIVFISWPQMPPGQECAIWATLTISDYSPRDVSSIDTILILIAWADAEETIPSDEYTLGDDPSTSTTVTNALGQVYNTLVRAATTETGTNHYEIVPVAIPKVPA